MKLHIRKSVDEERDWKGKLQQTWFVLEMTAEPTNGELKVIDEYGLRSESVSSDTNLGQMLNGYRDRVHQLSTLLHNETVLMKGTASVANLINHLLENPLPTTEIIDISEAGTSHN